MIQSTTALVLLLCLVAPGAHAADSPVQIGSVPPLSTRDLDGKRFVLEDALETGPAVITFWATWCKPCRKEMPELQKLRAEFGELGFQVIAVNGDGPVDQAKVRPFVKAQKFDFTVLPDQDGEIRRRFQVEVFPTTFLVNTDGAILHRSVGYRRGDELLLKAQLAALFQLEATPLEGDGEVDTPDPDQ